jgi:hypothetical protein
MVENKSKFKDLESEAEALAGGVGRELKKEVSRWPALVALLVIAGVYWFLPDQLAVGPRWLLFLLIGGLVAPAYIFHRLGNHRLNHYISLVLCFLVTLAIAASIFLLLKSLPDKTIPASTLLWSAGWLWATNIGVFAVVYWQIEAGGPNGRSHESTNEYHRQAELLFPQLTLVELRPEFIDWRPNFLDYLFVAFNTSAAFSPTDTPILSTRLKVLSMIQSVLSLITVVTLAGRAINIL